MTTGKELSSGNIYKKEAIFYRKPLHENRTKQSYFYMISGNLILTSDVFLNYIFPDQPRKNR